MTAADAAAEHARFPQYPKRRRSRGSATAHLLFGVEDLQQPDRALGVAVDEEADLLVGELAAVALGAQDVEDVGRHLGEVLGAERAG